mmetsp:Transcript_10644/g.23510  ORF Transcript_10644/g.23510 Transcript_10644/m.23510 type:complete len:141 (+) Transcript_10644:726-1148(+)
MQLFALLCLRCTLRPLPSAHASSHIPQDSRCIPLPPDKHPSISRGAVAMDHLYFPTMNSLTDWGVALLPDVVIANIFQKKRCHYLDGGIKKVPSQFRGPSSRFDGQSSKFAVWTGFASSSSSSLSAWRARLEVGACGERC